MDIKPPIKPVVKGAVLIKKKLPVKEFLISEEDAKKRGLLTCAEICKIAGIKQRTLRTACFYREIFHYTDINKKSIKYYSMQDFKNWLKSSNDPLVLAERKKKFKLAKIAKKSFKK